MSRIFLFSCLVCLTPLFSAGQEIFMIENFGGVQYETDTLILTSRDLLDIFRDEPLVYREFRMAQTNHAISSAMGFTGGLLIAIPVVSAIADGQPEWVLAGGGLALILGSIPLKRSFSRHAGHAIDSHNQAFLSRLKTSFYFGGSGGRLIIKF